LLLLLLLLLLLSFIPVILFFQGFPETVQILLQFGAHINSQTTAGETALMRVSGHSNLMHA